MTNEIINKTAKPNSISFRYGGTGTDIKIYFEDAEDLEHQLIVLASKSATFNNKIKEIKEVMSR